jgi:hypothetical protein
LLIMVALIVLFTRVLHLLCDVMAPGKPPDGFCRERLAQRRGPSVTGFESRAFGC